MNLRPYQVRLITDIRAAMARAPRVLAVLPTGGGKTLSAAHMVAGAAARGLTSYFLVHRRELVQQTSAAFAAQGIPHSLVQAGSPLNPRARTFVASVQTLANRLHLAPACDLMIVDEAHHVTAPQWGKVIAGLQPRWTIGLTATPCRLDGQGLDAHFDALVQGPTVAELTALGHLAPARVFAPATAVDLTRVRTTAGDWNRRDLATALDQSTVTGDAVDHYRRHAPGRRAVVFAVSVEHATHLAQAFTAAGFPAASIDGSMAPHERDRILTAFGDGRTPVLTSCDLVSEGFDLPAIEVAISLRPTQSLSLWLQQVGRCLRPAPGKTHALILDHAGNTLRHGLPDTPREWSLQGRPRRAGSQKPAPVQQCPACFAVHAPAPACPQCGASRPTQDRRPQEIDGELVELDAAARARIAEARKSEEREARTLADFERIAAARGYKPGWARHRFEARMKRAASWGGQRHG